MANTYQSGSSIVLTGTFKNPSAVLTDPTVVVCKVRTPGRTLATPTPINTSTGVWAATYSLLDADHGTYHYRFEGTGAIQAAAEGSFIVAESNVL